MFLTDRTTRTDALEAWRDAARLVSTRWEVFREADAESRPWAFASYVAALDAEEAAAAEMAGLLSRRAAGRARWNSVISATSSRSPRSAASMQAFLEERLELLARLPQADNPPAPVHWSRHPEQVSRGRAGGESPGLGDHGVQRRAPTGQLNNNEYRHVLLLSHRPEVGL